jgi:hypothetical protein
MKATYMLIMQIRYLFVNDGTRSPKKPTNTESAMKCVICAHMLSRDGFGDARPYPIAIDLNMTRDERKAPKLGQP